MNATSERGWQMLRRKAKEELSRFQLKMILQREDLTWLNIVELTEQAIAKATTYSFSFSQKLN